MFRTQGASRSYPQPWYVAYIFCHYFFLSFHSNPYGRSGRRRMCRLRFVRLRIGCPEDVWSAFWETCVSRDSHLQSPSLSWKFRAPGKPAFSSSRRRSIGKGLSQGSSWRVTDRGARAAKQRHAIASYDQARASGTRHLAPRGSNGNRAAGCKAGNQYSAESSMRMRLIASNSGEPCRLFAVVRQPVLRARQQFRVQSIQSSDHQGQATPVSKNPRSAKVARGMFC